MRKVHVDQLKENMIISKPIYTHNGIILLNEGTNLTLRYIEKIKKTGLKYVYITDKISEGIQMTPIISEKVQKETKALFKKSIEQIKKGSYSASEQILKQVEHIINEILLNPRVILSFQEIRNKSDYLSYHSINVCVLSLLMAKKMGYIDSQLMHLGVGALLHDIGKINFDFDCFRYREDYVEIEAKIYNEHPQDGYDLIRDMQELSLVSATIIRTHHEHYDGTGFPLGLKGDAIHMFSKIVAVANEYDNLVYNLPPHKSMKNHEVIEYVTSRAYTVFDPEVIKVFRNTIVPYPLGNGVLLSDGRKGIVSKVYEHIPSRPVVRIIDSEKMEIIEEVDLSEKLYLVIQDEVDIDRK